MRRWMLFLEVMNEFKYLCIYVRGAKMLTKCNFVGMFRIYSRTINGSLKLIYIRKKWNQMAL